MSSACAYALVFQERKTTRKPAAIWLPRVHERKSRERAHQPSGDPRVGLLENAGRPAEDVGVIVVIDLSPFSFLRKRKNVGIPFFECFLNGCRSRVWGFLKKRETSGSTLSYPSLYYYSRNLHDFIHEASPPSFISFWPNFVFFLHVTNSNNILLVQEFLVSIIFPYIFLLFLF